MRRIGLIVVALAAVVFVASAAGAKGVGDSVRGSGAFTIIESTVPNPFVDYNVKLAVDVKSGPNGEAPSGRITATLTKPGEDRQTFRIAVDCIEITDGGGGQWVGWNVLVGGPVVGNGSQYGWAIPVIFTNVQNSGNDYANF